MAEEAMNTLGDLLRAAKIENGLGLGDLTVLSSRPFFASCGRLMIGCSDHAAGGMDQMKATAKPAPIKASLSIGGEEIRLGRLALHWTQGDLAERSGVNRVTIGTIEAGDIDKVRIATIRALVRALEAGGVEFTPGGVRKALDQRTTREEQRYGHRERE
jgi:DNA-binding XRE family transcriptional regulator